MKKNHVPHSAMQGEFLVVSKTIIGPEGEESPTEDGIRSVSQG